LYIGGAGLARGYLRRPGLTAERFTPDPFSGAMGARMYRTGDLTRCRADGRLEFLGRRDHQVKIRGFRVETGEVEAVLGQHQGLRQAVVVAGQDSAGETCLVAYVVGAGGITPAVGDLRAHLAGQLPGYMVPSAFVALDRLPLTPAGKLDRSALPSPSAAGLRPADAFLAPGTPAEEAIAAIWAAAFKVERVGVNDNFFELGGHSLLATRVIARIREALHCEIPLRAIFEEPTVAGLARIVGRDKAADERENAEEALQELDQLSDEEAERLLADLRERA
jgi:nonribosomal peptide synthetase DhbF